MSTAPDPQALADLRSDMLRFARRQVADRAMAEDAVHDALVAALCSGSRFAGRSALKTWLFGIVSHKIADQGRRALRHTAPLPVEDEDDLPGPWPEPHDDLERSRFWQGLGHQLAQLPPLAGQVFVLKEVLGWDTGEIEHALGVSAGHCHVIVHRTRARLREALAPAYRPKNA